METENTTVSPVVLPSTALNSYRCNFRVNGAGLGAGVDLARTTLPTSSGNLLDPADTRLSWRGCMRRACKG